MVHKSIFGTLYPPSLRNTGLSRHLPDDGSDGYDQVVGLPVVPIRGPIKRACWLCTCGRRVSTLFRPLSRTPTGLVFQDVWRCRICCGYSSAGTEVASTGLGAVVRAYGQAQRIERIIGKGRPKGMWVRRYEQLLHEHQRYMENALAGLDTYSTSLLKQMNAAAKGVIGDG